MVISSKLLRALLGPAYRLEVTATAVDLSQIIVDRKNFRLLHSAIAPYLADLAVEFDPERSPETLGGTFRVFFAVGEGVTKSVLVAWGVSMMASLPREASEPKELAA